MAVTEYEHEHDSVTGLDSGSGGSYAPGPGELWGSAWGISGAIRE